MTFFGQFFDHGLDLVTKGGNGTVFIPLQPDDPLYVPGQPHQLHGADARRPCAGPDGTRHRRRHHAASTRRRRSSTRTRPIPRIPRIRCSCANTCSSDGRPDRDRQAARRATNGGLATWADVKAQAQTCSASILTDADVVNVPLLAPTTTATSSAAPTASRRSSLRLDAERHSDTA